jgi:D-alanyl-D-alanine carboxypeptidase (penicillin-binding protein 5/6)
MRRLSWAVAVAVAAWSLAPAAAAAPLPPIERLPIPPPPTVTAASWILYDAGIDTVLAGFETDSERPMASTTKIMTALVAYDAVRPGQRTVVSARADRVGESEIGLVQGESVEVEPLIDALLIRSGNDAAIAVAEALGDSVEGFVDLMNQRAAALGLEHTHFENPHGLDENGHYSSARDLLLMALAAMDEPRFAEAVATRRMRLPDAPDGTERIAETTNQLLFDYPGAIGVKTGFTFRAGLVLVASAERDGRRLYAVVMGSEGPGAHFDDARRLLDYGFQDLRLVATITQGASYRLVDAEELAALSAQATIEALLHTSAMARSQVVTAAPVVESPQVVALSSSRLPGLERAWRWLFGGDG